VAAEIQRDNARREDCLRAIKRRARRCCAGAPRPVAAITASLGDLQLFPWRVITAFKDGRRGKPAARPLISVAPDKARRKVLSLPLPCRLTLRATRRSPLRDMAIRRDVSRGEGCRIPAPVAERELQQVHGVPRATEGPTLLAIFSPPSYTFGAVRRGARTHVRITAYPLSLSLSLSLFTAGFHERENTRVFQRRGCGCEMKSIAGAPALPGVDN